MSGELSFSIPEPEQLPRPQRREIVDGLLAVAFARLGLNSVRASAGTESRSSVALLKEAGFAPIGRRRATHVVDGTLRDDVLFDMLRSDHEARRAAAPAGAAGP
jgi:RimJ/RimL family protein N-acetyltransferase